jgi:hypothetical protein
MPRPRKQTDIESAITQIVSATARQIAEAVRAEIAEQLRHVTAAGATAKGRQARALAPAKADGQRRGRRARLDEATVSRVLKVVADSPGLRSEQIQGKLPIPPKVVKAALAKLRADKRVKTAGEKRATTYTIAAA